MAIEPDTKNWTWVLERACPDCGFEAASIAREEVGTRLRDNVARWRPLLEDDRAARRWSPDVWSALEYGCHVRDVFRLFDQRLALMLDEDEPTFANWDQDVTAVEDDYGSQDPAQVLVDLEAAGARLADSFDAVPAGAWDRTSIRSDGARFTVESFARYLLHDPVHHVWDVEQGYAGSS